MQISDFRFQIGLVLAACLVAAPRLAAAQLPSADVTVADTRASGGLSLTIFTATTLGSTVAPSVLIGVEVDGLPGRAAAQANLLRQLELGYLAEIGGTTVARHALTVPMGDAATVRRAAEQGLRVIAKLPLAAGQYRLRVTVRDTGDGRTASVVHGLDVPNLIGEPLTMSDLVMTASKVGGVTYPEPDADALSPLVGRPPTGRRQFSRGEKVEVNAEIYEAPTCDGLGVNLNVATTILTPEGRVLHESVDIGTSETLPTGVFGYQHYALVPIATLPPGPYILRVSVSVDGATAVWRAMPITVTDEKVKTEN